MDRALADLGGKGQIVNRVKKRACALVADRNAQARTLALLLQSLGIERRDRPPRDLSTYLASKAAKNAKAQEKDPEAEMTPGRSLLSLLLGMKLFSLQKTSQIWRSSVPSRLPGLEQTGTKRERTGNRIPSPRRPRRRFLPTPSPSVRTRYRACRTRRRPAPSGQHRDRSRPCLRPACTPTRRGGDAERVARKKDWEPSVPGGQHRGEE